MTKAWTTRARVALRASFTLEGLVVAMVGGAVWAIAGGILAQLADFRLGPALAIGGGSGLLAAAAFLWLVVIPRRRRETAARATLRPRLKKLLRDWAAEGELRASLASGGSKWVNDVAAWQANVRSLLMDILGSRGPQKVFVVSTPFTVKAEARRLRTLADRLDDWSLREIDLDLLPQP